MTTTCFLHGRELKTRKLTLEGADKMKQAKEIGESAQNRYKQTTNSLDRKRQDLHKRNSDFIEKKVRVFATTFSDFIDLLKKLEQKARLKEYKKQGIAPLQREIGEIEKCEGTVTEALRALGIGVQTYLAGSLAGSAAGSAAGAGASALASSIGVASTGTAIGTLSGAAAHSAFFAWLGGGAIAIGGGGMALGAVIFGGIVAAPALLIGGFVLGGQGEKALTDAKKFEADVDVAIAQINTFMAMLDRLERRFSELENIIDNLNRRLKDVIGSVHPARFNTDHDSDMRKLQKCFNLARALRAVMEVRVMEDDGRPTDSSYAIVSKYSVNNWTL
jgi:hypothetical protein